MAPSRPTRYRWIPTRSAADEDGHRAVCRPSGPFSRVLRVRQTVDAFRVIRTHHSYDALGIGDRPLPRAHPYAQDSGHRPAPQRRTEIMKFARTARIGGEI